MYSSQTRIILCSFLILILGCKHQNKKNQHLSKKDTDERLNTEIFRYSKSAKNIDSLLKQKYLNGKFNGNVLVVQNGIEIYNKSFGYANGSKRIKLNKNYRFNIGSVYKEFPAVSIMQLEEQGKLDLKDKLTKYVKDLPHWSASITIKSLLQYSSGLPEVKWDEYFSKGITVTEKIIVNDLKNIKKLKFKPETDYLYSNYSPLLLSKIVEKITNQDFQSYVQENIFTPYGLNQLKIDKQYPYDDKTLMAIPFNDDFEEDNYKTTVPLVLFSATTLDMYKWFELLDSFKILSKRSIEFLSEETKSGNNIQAPLGRCEWKNDKIIEHSHHGASASYECVIRRFKQKKLTIVILTNQKHENVYDISDEIIKILNNAYKTTWADQMYKH